MKTIIRSSIILLVSVVMFTSCFTTRVSPIDRLTIGMNKQEVYNSVGYPSRLLEAGYVQGKYLEVLEYRINSDVYAFEFWNDYLTSCEFLYEDYNYYYAPPTMPPPYFPDRGRPIIVVRPPQDNYPPNTGRPPYRPDVSGERPSSGSGSVSRPETSGQRPSEPTSRPNTSGSGVSTRPSGTGSSSGGRYNSSSSSEGRTNSSGSTTNSGRYNSGSSSSGGRSESSGSNSGGGSTRNESSGSSRSSGGRR